MSKHTQGEWTQYEGMIVESKSESMKICDIRGWGRLTGSGHGGLGLSHDEAKAIQIANANLIAAAPDMLEALEKMVAGGGVWTDAREAIAKAKGEKLNE